MHAENPFIFVVDDDRSIRDSLSDLLRSAGLNVQTFASAQAFLTSPHPEAPSCLVLDVQLPGLSGLDLQQELAKGQWQIPIIFITGHGDIPMTVRAMKAGAIEFLTKPCRDDDLLHAVEQALHRSRQLASGQHPPADEPAEAADARRRDSSFSAIVGHSAALRRVLQAVETVAPTEATVLLSGETGTGKDVIARAIHLHSRRRQHPFVKLNCAAIPTGLLESELFGHEKGAFTGAIAPRMGRFELAHRGTLLLDEIGELPLELQPKLLRVLHERTFERLGSSRTVHTDARLIAATNADLAQLVAAKQFRRDLYYRLHVFPIVIPPLRERRDDIPLLVRYFVHKYAGRMHKRIETIPAQAMSALTDYHWPGNVRELEHFIERAVILSPAPELQPPLAELLPPLPSASAAARLGLKRPPGGRVPVADLPAEVAAASAGGPPPAGALGALPMTGLDVVERDAIRAAILTYHGNLTQVARALHIAKSTLYLKIERYALDHVLRTVRPSGRQEDAAGN